MVTVLTRTIGPSGRDYASFTLAEADVTNIGTSADLVANDEAIVFEADAGTYSESVTFSSTLTTDATRNVTYKPAAGSEHGGVPGQGVRIQFGNLAISSVCVRVDEPFTVIEGLELDWTDTSGSGRTCDTTSTNEGVSLDRCLLRHAGTGVMFQCSNSNTSDLASNPMRVTNCALDGSGFGFRLWNLGASEKAWEVINCTITCASRAFDIYSATHDSTFTFTNNLILSASEDLRDQGGGGTSTVLGSNNFGPQTSATHIFPAALKGSPYPITPTTSFSTPLGSGDYAVYMGATGALADVTGNDVWQQGVGPASNSDVPTTDINGVTRSGTSCNPGAFEADGFVAPTVLTRTIGSGKDYSTFTLAEAAVTSIGSGTDLTFYNEAIVFEADAGSYNERLSANSTLTTDATRNVTYKAAAGSEHDGSLGRGVYLNLASSDVAQVYDAHVNLRGITISGTAYTISAQTNSHGLVVDSCVVYSSATLVFQPALQVISGNAASPTTVTNTVLITDGIPYCARIFGDVALRNCTTIGGVGVRIEAGTKNIGVEVTNHLSLGSSSYQATVSTGSITLSGSNNFGGSTDPFPVAIQGSPYPITATTDTSPGAGDWAIYQASNGQLYNIVANDVWQQGVGPTANADVPATDILGVARYGATANPGAFELGLPVPGIRVKPRHFQVNTAATAHAVSVWQPQLRKL